MDKISTWWDKEYNLIRCESIGNVDEASAIETKEITAQLLEKHGPSDMLVNVSENTGTSSKARKELTELSAQKKLGKLAFYGMSLPVRVAINFVMQSAGKKNTKQFQTEKEALEWLAE